MNLPAGDRKREAAALGQCRQRSCFLSVGAGRPLHAESVKFKQSASLVRSGCNLPLAGETAFEHATVGQGAALARFLLETGRLRWSQIGFGAGQDRITGAVNWFVRA